MMETLEAMVDLSPEQKREAEQLFSRALTGFNEGITEMFAQDYLKAEIKNGYDFKGENQHLATSKKIVRPSNSYDPQVSVIRCMVRLLGDDKRVREAYIQHDFSIITSAIDKTRKSQLKEKIDWDIVMEKMAEIQQLYSGKKTDASAAIKITRNVDMIVAMLEG